MHANKCPGMGILYICGKCVNFGSHFPKKADSCVPRNDNDDNDCCLKS